MDSSSDNEDVLIIDDNSCNDEDAVIDLESSHSSVQGSPGVPNQQEIYFSPLRNAVIDLDSSLSSVQDSPGIASQPVTANPPVVLISPLRNNHPKLKRKFQGDYSWKPTVLKETSDVKPDESILNSNGTENHSPPPNSLEEHTYAKKISSPQDPIKDCSSTCDEEKGFEKLQIELSALCTVLYSSQNKKIFSISIDQFYNLNESLNLQDVTPSQLNSSNSYSRRGRPGRGRPPKLKMTPPLRLSSFSNCGSENGTERITFKSLPKTEECVCYKPCICSKIFESKNIIKTPIACKVEPIVTSTSNSDEVPIPPKKIERRGRPRKYPLPKVETEPGVSKPVDTPRAKKISSVTKEVSSSIPSGVHQCPPECKYGKDLLVFAKWPADKIYYPAIVHGCFYTDWEYSNNLNVQFFDGASIKMSSCNIFPASLVVKGALITYKNGEDEYIDGIVKSVERTHPFNLTKSNTCLSFITECTEKEDSDFGKVLNIAFTSVALNDQCYKFLKKEIGETVLTPHKFSRKTYNVCHDNLIEGKRTRRGAEEAVALILSEELDRKENFMSDESCIKRRRGRKKVINEETSPTNCDPKKGIKRKRSSTNKNDTSTETNEICSPQTTEGLESQQKKRRTPKTPYAKSEKKTKLNHSEIPSTSTSKRPRAMKELVFRKDVVSEEEHSDSEPDDDFDPDFDVSIVGGGDLDYECTTLAQTSKKCLGNRVIKSSSKKTEIVIEDDESVINRCGPIPQSPLFAGYSFVLTHGGENSYYKKKEQISELNNSDDDDPFVFDQLRLRKQIIAGKGHIFKHLLSIPKDSRDKSIVISDFHCRTANYLLSAALNVPIYSHHLIIQCCIQNVPLEEMMNSKQPLLFGITSDQVKHKFTKKRKVETMKSCTVIFASTESNQRLRFWTKLIHLSGGKISYFTPKRSALGAVLSFASVVIVDDYCTTYLLDSAKKNNIPVVSTRWLVDTIIRGHKQTMMSTELPQYQVDIMSSQTSLSEAQ